MQEQMNDYIPDAARQGLPLSPEEFLWKVRVRYAETDRMGRAYHGAFVPWLEVARVEWLRHRGLAYAELEARGWLLPVTALNIRYLKPVPYDAEVNIRVRAKVEGVRLHFTYALDVEGEPVATAEVELVSVDAATGRPKRWTF
jgi:acyl-CoA thioester hydrolase